MNVTATIHPHTILTAPPTIIYTTEFIVHSEREFGQSGQLTCMVQISPDTSSHVTWWTNGTQLKNSEKYIVDSVANGEEDVIQHRLTVRNLQHSDIGSYLCQLSSDFSIETSQPAWVQVDFRKSKYMFVVIVPALHASGVGSKSKVERPFPREARKFFSLFLLSGQEAVYCTSASK